MPFIVSLQVDCRENFKNVVANFKGKSQCNQWFQTTPLDSWEKEQLSTDSEGCPRKLQSSESYIFLLLFLPPPPRFTSFNWWLFPTCLVHVSVHRGHFGQSVLPVRDTRGTETFYDGTCPTTTWRTSRHRQLVGSSCPWD